MEPTLQVQGLNPTEPAVPQNPVAPSSPAANSAQPTEVPLPGASIVSNTPVTEQPAPLQSLPEKPKRNLKSFVFILLGIVVLGAGAYFIFRAPSEELTGRIGENLAGKDFKSEKPSPPPSAPKPPPAPAPESKAPDLPSVDIKTPGELPPQAKIPLEDAGPPASPAPPAPPAPPPAIADLKRAAADLVADKTEKVGGADRLLALGEDAEKEPKKQPEPVLPPPAPPPGKGERLEDKQVLEVAPPDRPGKPEPIKKEDLRIALDDGGKTKEEDEAAKLKAALDAKKAESEEREKAEAAKKAKEEAEKARLKTEQDAQSKAEAEAFKKMIEEKAEQKKLEEEKEKQKKADAESAARIKTELEAKKKADAEEKAKALAAKKAAEEEKRKAEVAELLALVEEEEEPIVPPPPTAPPAPPPAATMEKQLEELKQQLAAALRNQDDASAFRISALRAEIAGLNEDIEDARAYSGATAVSTACADPSFTYDPVRKVCIPPTAVTVIPEKEKAKEISIVTKKDKKTVVADTAAAGTEGETEASAVAAAAAKAKAAAAAKAAGAASGITKAGTSKVSGAKVAGASSGAIAGAKKLHGAAIQGETGPGILLYPLLLASANGLFYAFKKRKKLIK